MNFNKKAGIGALISTFLATIVIIILLIIAIFSSGAIKKFERGDRLKEVADGNIILKESITYVRGYSENFLTKRLEFQRVVLAKERGEG